MSLESMPDDILMYITQNHLENPIDFTSTCKRTNDLVKRYGGYAHHMEYNDIRDDIFTFVRQMMIHGRTCKSIHVIGLDDPVTWLPYWPETVVLENVYVKDNYINPPRATRTKTLIVKNDKYYINPEKFPCLEKYI